MSTSILTPALPPPPHERILAITAGFWQSRALAVSAELELAELLARGPLHVDVLAGRTKTHSPTLFRLLRNRNTHKSFTSSLSLPSPLCIRAGLCSSKPKQREHSPFQASGRHLAHDDLSGRSEARRCVHKADSTPASLLHSLNNCERKA